MQFTLFSLWMDPWLGLYNQPRLSDLHLVQINSKIEVQLCCSVGLSWLYHLLGAYQFHAALYNIFDRFWPSYFIMDSFFSHLIAGVIYYGRLSFVFKYFTNFIFFFFRIPSFFFSCVWNCSYSAPLFIVFCSIVVCVDLSIVLMMGGMICNNVYNVCKLQSGSSSGTLSDFLLFFQL